MDFKESKEKLKEILDNKDLKYSEFILELVSLYKECKLQEMRDEIKDLSERVETLEKKIIEEKEEEIEKLKAELDYAKKAVWDFSSLEQDSILNKVRAKIEVYKLATNHAISEDELKIEGMKEAYINCLEIIDRLIAESEEYNEKRNKLPQGFDYALCWVESEE